MVESLTPNQKPSGIPTGLQDPAPASDDQAISWTGSEFILHEKTAGWYLALGLAAAAISAVIYFITKDFVPVAAILFGVIIFGIYAGRKPRQLNYEVNSKGILVGNRSFMYGEFRSFSVVQEGAFSSIVLVPLKRFSPLLIMYYPPEREEAIVNMVANYLPIEERHEDLIDRLMHKVGF